MNLFAALGIGVLAGIVGVVPFFVARRRIKARMKKDGVGSIITGMVAVLISFAIMVVEILIFNLFAADYLLPFAICAIVVFLLAIGAFTATLMRR